MIRIGTTLGFLSGLAILAPTHPPIAPPAEGAIFSNLASPPTWDRRVAYNAPGPTRAYTKSLPPSKLPMSLPNDGHARQILTLENLPAGSYVIFGRLGIRDPRRTNVSCTLDIPGHDLDTEGLRDEPGSVVGKGLSPFFQTEIVLHAANNIPNNATLEISCKSPAYGTPSGSASITSARLTAINAEVIGK